MASHTDNVKVTASPAAYSSFYKHFLIYAALFTKLYSIASIKNAFTIIIV
jgi:hypothetical protein